MKLLVRRALALCGALCAPWSAIGAEPPSEREYFEELPVVLSVSRLAQPLDETPGAVTLIDRDSIRRLGARDVYDVLRFVPGFLVSGWNGASPSASYHSVLDQYGSKLQVFIDGRSVYSTFFLGGTQRGLQGVNLEDIERIEVLRGTNSAAYGANAFLGVVNIVTRHTADTRGALVSVSGGEDGIYDNVARIGWGSDEASFRISTSHRADHGRDRVYDESRLGELNFRADLRPTHRDDVMLQAGGLQLSWGDGYPGALGNPERTPMMRSRFLFGEWRHAIVPGEDVRFSLSHDEEYFRDSTPYGDPRPIFRGVFLDWGGKAQRSQFEFQHSFSPAVDWRAVWGVTLRDERVWSPPLYYGQDWLSSQQRRLFGNLEWRPHPQWVVNAGATWERTSIVGDATSPRLMVNYHVIPGQTVRAGVTQSQRIPTLFEERADIRYLNTANMLVAWTWQMRGQVRPERLLVREVGYLGEFRSLGLTVDVRGYNEIMSDPVASCSYFNGRLLVGDKCNGSETLLMRGYEYQVRWQPTASTRLWWSHMSTRNIWPFASDANSFSAPQRSDALALFQTLPGDWETTLTYTETSRMTWAGEFDVLPPQHRVDARVAKHMRFGATRVEAAVTVQAASGSYLEYLPARQFKRRAFATLRLEY
ncbi:MAG TPA: TonB-dependent receptor [Rhodocyclaceae bacterium]